MVQKRVKVITFNHVPYLKHVIEFNFRLVGVASDCQIFRTLYNTS